MSLTERALVIVFSLSVTSPVLAEGMSYDCDTRAGHYSSVEVVQTGEAKAVVGTIMAATLVKHSNYRPVGSASLTSADGKVRITVRLRAEPVAKDDVKTSTVYLGILLYEKDKEGKDEYFASTNMQQLVGFAIEPLADTVRVTFGGRVREFPVKIGPNAVARASCSTGQFVFTDLALTPPVLP